MKQWLADRLRRGMNLRVSQCPHCFAFKQCYSILGDCPECGFDTTAAVIHIRYPFRAWLLDQLAPNATYHKGTV